MGLPTTGSLSFAQINECVRFTNGNVGINTTNPLSALDVNGAIQATGMTVSNLNITGAIYQNGSSYQASQWTTTSGNVSYTSGSVVATNLQATNATTNSLTATNVASTGITTGTLNATGLSTLTNVTSTNETIGVLIATTGITTGTLNATGLSTLTNLSCTNAVAATLNASTGITTATLNATGLSTLTNLSYSNASAATLNASTGITTASLNATGLSTLTNLSCTNASAATLNASTGITTAGLAATTITGGNMSLSGNLSIAGTLTAVNVTTTNLIDTNISTGTLTASGLTSLSNVTSTNQTTAVLIATTGITTGTLNATGLSTLTNLSYTNASAATLNASTGITTNNLNITGNIFQNGSPYQSSQWTTTSGNVSYTSGSVVIGTSNGSAGSLVLNSSSSGSVTITTQTSSGNYNFNLPTTSGSSGQVLMSGGGGSAPMTWVNTAGPATLARYQSSAQSIPNGSATTVLFDTTYSPYTVGTTGIGYSNGTFTNNNSSSITIEVSYTLAFVVNGSGQRISFLVDNNGAISGSVKTVNNGSEQTVITSSAVLTLSPGGSFVLRAYQNSGTSLATGSGGFASDSSSTIRISVVNGGFVVPGNGGSALSRYHSTTQSVTSSTNTTVLFDTLDTNNSLGATGFSYSNGVFTNFTTSPITIIITASITFAGNSTGTRAAWIVSSAATIGRLGFSEQIPNSSSSFTSLISTCVATIPASGTFNVIAFQSSGSALNIVGGTGAGSSIHITPISGYSGNINATSVTTGPLLATSAVTASFNSNTIGSLFTTGGNVGIGTTNPSGLLTLSGTSGNLLRFTTGNTTQSIYQDFVNGNGARGIIGLDGSGYGAFSTGALMMSTWSNNPIIFATNQIQRMTINTAGNVSIGTTTQATFNGITVPNNGSGIHWVNGVSRILDDGNLKICTDDTIHFNIGSNSSQLGTERMYLNSSQLAVTTAFVAGNSGNGFKVNSDSDVQIYCGATVVNNNTGDARVNIQDRSNNFISFYVGTNKRGSITVNGGGVAYNTSSDYRVKENVVPLTGASSRVKQLSVKRFNFIAYPGQTVDGFIAHEVATVVPEAITGAKDAVDANDVPVLQAIDQSKLVPLLAAALKESIAKIESLEAFIQSKFPGEYP